jgi:hypothetical protein
MIYPNIKNPTRRSASRKRRTGFFEFDSEDLRDTGRIMELFDHLTQKRRHPIAGSQEERLSIMCCAEHALRIGKKPIKLFLWMIGKWPESLQNIADMDEDSAHRRLKTWEEFRRGRNLRSGVSASE